MPAVPTTLPLPVLVEQHAARAVAQRAGLLDVGADGAVGDDVLVTPGRRRRCRSRRCSRSCSGGSPSRWRSRRCRRSRCRARCRRSGCRCCRWRSCRRSRRRRRRACSRPTMLGTIVTPQASPAISMPLSRLPEMTLVWTVWLPPVEVISMPLLPLGAMPSKASMPAKVLNVMKPLAVSATSMPLLALPRDHVAERDDAADLVLRDEPSISTPSLPLATMRGVVGADADEIGVDRRVVGIGDLDAVAAVAADARCSRRTARRRKCSRSASCRRRPLMATPS